MVRLTRRPVPEVLLIAGCSLNMVGIVLNWGTGFHQTAYHALTGVGACLTLTAATVMFLNAKGR